MKPVSVRFKFEGYMEEIRADTLLSSLLGYVNLLNEVHKQLNIPKKLNIYVSNTEKGSFIVDLNLLLDTFDKIKSLFGNALPFDIKDIVEVSAGLILLKAFLKKEKPKEVKKENDRVVIINIDNEKFAINETVYRLAKEDEFIDEAIIDMTESIEEDENIEGFEIKDNVGHTVKIGREKLKYLIIPNPIFEEKTRTITRENVYLTVLKLVFAENRKWEFIFEGNKISANIEDDDFIKNLDKYSFKRGTKLLCDLEILQVYSVRLDEFINREFNIKKVHKVVSPLESKRLF